MSRDSAPAFSASEGQLMGLAKLMKMAYDEVNLAPLGLELTERFNRNPEDAEALMDLATIMYLDFAPDIAAGLQQQALAIKRLYHLPAAGKPAVRLLAIMTPGDLMANVPLEFLVEDSDIALDMLYVAPDLPLPDILPEHDVLMVAINEKEAVQPLLAQLQARLEDWPQAVVNPPDRIALLTRDSTCALLKSAPGVVMPASVKIDKQTLEAVGSGTRPVTGLLDGADFPVLVRPVGTHAGNGLARLKDRAAVAGYLQARPDEDYYLTPFVEYSGTDGLYRKYRLALIDGRPYACHMAVSEHWMVHYLNAGMAESAEKRAEEARFMAEFDTGFAPRHQRAFQAIAERFKLDYMIIDCAETPDGKLLVFEIDSGAVIHAMDSEALFPYKRPQMRKVFAAFRALLVKAKQGKGVRS